jgi:hypothetical protein
VAKPELSRRTQSCSSQPLLQHGAPYAVGPGAWQTGQWLTLPQPFGSHERIDALVIVLRGACLNHVLEGVPVDEIGLPLQAVGVCFAHDPRAIVTSQA